MQYFIRKPHSRITQEYDFPIEISGALELRRDKVDDDYCDESDSSDSVNSSDNINSDDESTASSCSDIELAQDDDEDSHTQSHAFQIIESSLHEYFSKLASKVVTPTSFDNIEQIIVLLGIATAKQTYNLSNNAVSFMLQCLAKVEDSNKYNLPSTWNAAMNQLQFLSPSKFYGCSVCFRYIFVKEDKVCKVCNATRKQQEVLYIPLMKWLKFMFAHSSNFVSRFENEVDDGT